MDYEEFLVQIKLWVQRRMGKEAKIAIFPVWKNNSILMDAMSILEPGEQCSPALYMNEFYQEYLRHGSFELAEKELMRRYQYGKEKQCFNIEVLQDPKRVGKRIVTKLINREYNRGLLNEIPHRSFLNLAVVYSYLMEGCRIGEASVLIRNEHLMKWKMEPEQLEETAKENMKELLPWDFFSLAQMMSHEGEEAVKEAEQIPLYVLTNKEKYFGAAWMMDTQVLGKIGAQLGEDYYVLPSSVHECMIVPSGFGVDARGLQKMVKEINETQVEPEEILGDTIYSYDTKKERLRIAVE